MLVDKLLLAVGVKYHGEAVVGADNAVHLKAVHEKHREIDFFSAYLIEKCVL